MSTGSTPVTKLQIRDLFNDLLDVEPREADYQVLEMLGNTRDVLAEYVWDHWLGEPDEVTPDALVEQMAKAWDHPTCDCGEEWQS